MSGYFRCFNFRPASIAFPCFPMLSHAVRSLRSGSAVVFQQSHHSVATCQSARPTGPPTGSTMGHPPVIKRLHGSMMSVMSDMFGAGEAFTKSGIGMQTD